ncbi:hypothetical protein [uncultured Tateyamaria sp.]|uniref:hypothetical protein n=1 Tax=uncultured Tateyamaria sp. TaxID=455651 RepID=UPI002601BEAD|nr:hypothetical protein [uncultured Tateyamaria sp.]
MTLLNMAAHLNVLAANVTEIENVLVVAVQNTSVETPDIVHLQKFDAIGQSLRDLSRLATALAATGHGREAALNALVLESTRLLIDAPVSTLRPSSGVVDLF